MFSDIEAGRGNGTDTEIKKQKNSFLKECNTPEKTANDKPKKKKITTVKRAENTV